MKRLVYLIAVAMVFSLIGCENQDREFPNFDYNTIYFPEQYPLRTIVLGHDRVDNVYDKQHIFHIGVSIGGLARNDRSWEIGFEIDDRIADSVVVAGDTIVPMPTTYYNIVGSPNTVTIPSGKMEGLIQVQLTDAFFADTMSLKRRYAIGLRITDKGDADSILLGKKKSEELGADIRKSGDWDVQPKYFTLFMVNYINEYSGKYFFRGAEEWVNEASRDTVVAYRATYLHDNDIRVLSNITRTSVIYEGLGVLSGATAKSRLSFNGSAITVSTADGGTPVSGSGTFYDETKPEAESLAGMKYPTMYLTYQYEKTLGNSTIATVTVNDTLVRVSRNLDPLARFTEITSVLPYNLVQVY